MLKPFRVRDLLDDSPDSSSSPRDVRHGQNNDGCGILIKGCDSSEPSELSAGRASDGIVQLTSSEYDKTVTRNPEAKLRYIDEDDGESITVGSSLELAQRLDEPIPQWLLNTSAARLTPQASDADQAMHIFDIRRSTDVLNTWRDIHMETRSDLNRQSAGAGVGSKNLDRQAYVIDAPSNSDADMSLNDSRDVTSMHEADDVSDARTRWARRCNPPLFHDTSDAKEDNRSTGAETAGSSSEDAKGERGPSYMTAEGRKMANAAGANLRNSRNLLSGGKVSSFALPSPAQNFWSSQGLSEETPASNAKQDSQQKPGSDESPKEAQSQPLLSAFETELAKLMHEDVSPGRPVEPQRTSEASQTNNPETTQPRPQPPEQGCPRPSTTLSIETVAETMRSLLRGISHVTSDRTLFPEVERRLHDLQQHVPPHMPRPHLPPQHMQVKLSMTLKKLKAGVQTLSNHMEDAALSTRTAAERTGEMEFLVSRQVEGLRNLAHDLGQISPSDLFRFNSRNVSGRAGSQSHSPEQSSTIPQTSSAGAREESSRETASQMTTDLSNLVTPEAGSSAPDNSTSHPPVSQNRPNRPVSETTLFIGNLPSNTAEEKLHSLIASQGFLGKVNLPVDSATGKHEGLGYVKFPSTYAASAALQALNGANCDGKTLKVEFSLGTITEHSDEAAERRSSAGSRPGEDEITQESSQNLTRHPSSLKSSASRSGALKKRQSVNLAVPAEAPSDPANIRRARSLATLRTRETERNGISEYRRFRHLQPPAVPPKERLDAQNTDSNEEAKTAHRTSTTESLHQYDPFADFSARYPPVVGPRDSTCPPTNNQEPGNIGRRVRDDGNADCRTTLPGSFPQLEQPIYPQRTLSTNPVSLASLRSSRPHTYAPPTHNPVSAPRCGTSPLPPPVVSDRLPGAWPEENEPRYKSEDENHPTIPTRKPTRRSQPPPGYHETRLRDAHSGPAQPGRPIRRSATERQTRPRHPGYYERGSSPFADIPGAFPAGNQSTASLPFHAGYVPQPEMAANARNNKIEACALQLKALGFADGDTALLRIYAEAADCSLGNAIEMIEDERKALEQQGSARR